MIHYTLRCAQEHEFESWFRDSASFDVQASSGLLECPMCGTTKVDRALMAPALAKKSRKRAPASGEADRSVQADPVARPAPAPVAPPSAMAASGPRMPDQVRAMLQRFRSEVERNCEYVGPQFAEEARKMHRGETEGRGIYGETSPEQAEALVDEGIEVAKIPWIPRADG